MSNFDKIKTLVENSLYLVYAILSKVFEGRK
jgi:hypothetical protein